MDDGDSLQRFRAFTRIACKVVARFDNGTLFVVTVVVEEWIESTADFENRARTVLCDRLDNSALTIAGLAFFEWQLAILALICIEISHDSSRTAKGELEGLGET